MTESEIQCLRDNIDKSVEIQTIDGERLIAKVLFVTLDKDYEEHEVLYEVISSNMINSYVHLEDAWPRYECSE